MITRILISVRSNLIGWIALFVALGGTGYAAVSLPAGSVGSSQLRNHSITAVKFNPRFINGSVRAWVVAAANGAVLSGAGKPSVHIVNGGVPGVYGVTWNRVAIPSQRGCFAVTGTTGMSGPGTAGALLLVNRKVKPPWVVTVSTYGPQGQAAAESFYAAVLC